MAAYKLNFPGADRFYAQLEIRGGQALTALVQLGPIAKGAVLQLSQFAQSKNVYVRTLALHALRNVAPEEYELGPPR